MDFYRMLELALEWAMDIKPKGKYRRQMMKKARHLHKQYTRQQLRDYNNDTDI